MIKVKKVLLLIPITALQGCDMGQLVFNLMLIASLTAEEKYYWLNKLWVASANYTFPLVAEGKKNHHFQHSGLQTYKCSIYSKEMNGCLCKMCILFGRCKGGYVKLAKLVVGPTKTQASYNINETSFQH